MSVMQSYGWKRTARPRQEVLIDHNGVSTRTNLLVL